MTSNSLQLTRLRSSAVVTVVLSFGALVGCGSSNGEDAGERLPAPALQELSANPTSPSGRFADRPHYRKLLDDARARGSARVLVTLQTPTKLEAHQTEAEVKEQRGRIQAHQAAILGRLSRLTGGWHGNVKRFAVSPVLALEANPAAVEALAEMPEVADVQEEVFFRPVLAESTALVGATMTAAEGDNGAGQVVAIVDSGVESTHPELTGKIVSEACYSAWGQCPGGVTSSTAAGSGAPCAFADCEHGTMVAGTAAGRHGVAPGAGIIAIQIYSHVVNNPFVCGGLSECTTAGGSDILAAMERVYELRNTFKIAAVNMSFGSPYEYYPNGCNSILTPIIDNLRAANIAGVAAAGNWAINKAGVFQEGLNDPACTSGAVSVGAVKDGTVGVAEPVDAISSFSQTGSSLSLLAPGEGITVPTLGGGYYSNASGTSLAAPHVAGAWAVLKERFGNISVDEGLWRLAETATYVPDYRTGTRFTFPRINVDGSVDENPNLALGKAVTSSGNTCNSYQSPAKAVNGNGTDKWCAFGNNQWIQVDLGGLQPVRSFAIKHAEAGGEAHAYNTRDFKIELSRDAVTWNQVVSVTGNTSAATSHVLSAAQPARYVRFTAVTPVSSQLAAARIYELQVFGEPGTNLAISRPATSSAVCNGNETADKAVNGSVRNGWSDKWCSNVAGTKWLKVDLAFPSLINRVVIKHAYVSSEEYPTYNTRDFNVEASPDDVHWTTLFSVTGNTRPVTGHAFPATTARYVRLNVTNGGVDGVARIYEFEVYGQAGVSAL